MSDTQVLGFDQILVHQHYRLLPGAFTNQGTVEEPRLTGWVEDHFKGGLDDVVVGRIDRHTGNVFITDERGRDQSVHCSFLAPLGGPTDPIPIRPGMVPRGPDGRFTRFEVEHNGPEVAEVAVLREQMAANALLISQRFYQAAREQDWCRGAEEVIRDLNRELVGQRLIEDRNDERLRARRRFRVTRRVKFEVWHEVSYEVEAFDEESAAETDHEFSMDDYRTAMRRGIADGNWQVDDVDDGEVEAELLS